MGNKYIKRWSPLFITREIQVKIIMRYHITLAEWPSSKNLQTINGGEGAEKREPSYTVGRNAN